MMEWIGITLFLLAVAGHGVLVIASHNRWYGTGLPHKVIDLIQLAHALLLLAGVIAFVRLIGLDFTPLLRPGQVPQHLLPLAAYVYLCWFAVFAFVVLTVRRLLRGKPAVLESNHTRTVDVAKELGYKPAGGGKRGFLARLPYNEVFQVDLNEKTLRLKRLPPAWDGLSILHISDVHFVGTPDRPFFRYVMEQCAAWAPDLIAFTGDTVDSDTHHRWIVPMFGRLKSRYGSFAILGNHDIYFDTAMLRRRLGRAGMRVIGNGWTQIEVRGEPMVVIGNETPWVRPAPDLSACPVGPFRLCLSHTPDNIPWARKHGIDLMLAGHVHGGQIRFPIIGSVVVPSGYGRRYDCGAFDEAPVVMHVSRGLGGQDPLRYNCRPEVSKLILRRA